MIEMAPLLLEWRGFCLWWSGFAGFQETGEGQQDIELMTEREVFQNQRTAGPQSREQRAEKNQYHAIHDTIRSNGPRVD
jgi:hypothetical protein